MKLDIVGFVFVGVVILFLLVMLSVVVRGSIYRWLDYRSKIVAARNKKK